MVNLYYQELKEQFIPENISNNSPLGNKPLDLKERQSEARRISQLLNQNRSFCFVRLGDMDLVYLLASQENQLSQVNFGEGKLDGTLPQGNPGISSKYSERLRIAFENADYVDFHERLYPMEYLLPLLKLNRSEKLYRNPNKETSYISLTWLEYEFKHYCQNKRIGIAGAEASLLQELTTKEVWQKASQPYWPENSSIFFHQVRNDGRQLDKNLDLIKQDLKEFIQKNQINTLFLSLGGGAKILCYELSRELDVVMFDFGAMIRALTYSASDGNQTARSSHSPFLFRIPFDTMMLAIEKNFKNLTPEQLLAKTHAQLLLELQFKQCGWTHTWQEYDFSEENLFHFRNAYRYYKKHYKRYRNYSQTTQKEFKNFRHICGFYNLSLEGIIFYKIFLMKSLIKRLLNKIT